MVDNSGHVLVFTLIQISGGIWGCGQTRSVSSALTRAHAHQPLAADIRANMGNNQSDLSISLGMCNMLLSNKEKKLPSRAEGKMRSLFLVLLRRVVCNNTSDWL